MSMFRLKMIKQQRVGVLLLIVFIIALEIFLHKDKFIKKSSIIVNELPHSIKSQITEFGSSYPKDSLKFFDPNQYTSEDWQKIGFTKKQSDVILKYKELLGGTFTSKEQIRKCFVISEEKYKELESYIQLPEKFRTNTAKQEIQNLQKNTYSLTLFDPNDYTLHDWVKIGFTKKQAEVILKYKGILGGKFTSKEQIKKCFVVSDEKYKELEAYIRLPEGESSIRKQLKSTLKNKIDLNKATYNDIYAILGDAVLAKRLISFRNGLGGFVSKNQLDDVYGITSRNKDSLLNAFVVKVENIKKINLNKATEDELQRNIYLRKYKNKIIELRLKGENPIKAISSSDSKYQWILQYLE